MPLGVTDPSYTDENGVTTTYTFSSDNRGQLIDHFPYKSANSPVLAPTGTCDSDCNEAGQVNCPVGDLTQCSELCLPGLHYLDNQCLPRLEANAINPSTMKITCRYQTGQTQGKRKFFEVQLNPGSIVRHLEFFLTTVDENGSSDYSWVTNSRWNRI